MDPNISADVQKTVKVLLQTRVVASSCNGLDTKAELMALLEHHKKLQHAISQEIESHSALVRYKLNSFLPLHTLPAELFREILVQALLAESEESSNTWKHVCKLASVCKHWFDTVAGEPRLWIKITSADPPLVTATKLRNSKGAELDMELDLVGRMPGITADAEEEWLAEALSGESRRWRSLAFRSASCPRWVRQALDGSAPLLRDLCARIPWGWQGGTEGRINLGEEGVTLRRLRLECVGFAWDSPRLADLKYLSLSDISTHAPTLSRLRGILQSSPKLETLSLTNVRCHTDEVDHGPVHLPHLKTFKLEGMLQAVSRNLVCSIHASHGCGILVRPLEAADFATSSLQAAISRWVEAPFQATGSIFLAVDGNIGELTIRTAPSPHFEVWKPETWPDQGARGAFLAIDLAGSSTPIYQVVDILKASNTAAIIHLDIRWYGIEHQRQFPVEVLDNLGGLQQMTVLGPLDTKAVMDHLARPKLSQQGHSWSWACPNLMTLRVGSADPGEIAKLVRSRREHHGKENEPLPREISVDCLLS